MTSDDQKPRKQPSYGTAGPGHSVQFRCSKCQQPMPNWGRKLQLVRGVKAWVGRCCQTKGAPA